MLYVRMCGRYQMLIMFIRPIEERDRPSTPKISTILLRVSIDVLRNMLLYPILHLQLSNEGGSYGCECFYLSNYHHSHMTLVWGLFQIQIHLLWRHMCLSEEVCGVVCVSSSKETDWWRIVCVFCVLCKCIGRNVH